MSYDLHELGVFMDYCNRHAYDPDTDVNQKVFEKGIQKIINEPALEEQSKPSRNIRSFLKSLK